jgi:metal-responsive CopG/Arc/MetJ family transcriptional regulator
MRPDHKPILINVPTKLLQQLDKAAGSLDLSRSELVRRSLHRDLKFVVKHEVEEASRAKAKTATLYDDWIQRA